LTQLGVLPLDRVRVVRSAHAILSRCRSNPPCAYKTGALGVGSLRLIEGTISRQSLRKKAREKSS
jgi:hypothetical protein